ncbi:MAG TPA: hypothetical protein VFE60_01020 [Roseiarcus sp.]|jgi:hypothetical protein|nr:hypothetical protein [Roseiarcus sp.]
MTIMTEQTRHARLTFLAIVNGGTGYSLDCYPEELADARRDYGKYVIGEFPTYEAANSAVGARMAADCAILNAREKQRPGPSKRRSLVTPVTVHCPVCKGGYVRGLPGEARLHAAFHASYMYPRKPRPEPRLAAFGDDVRVERDETWNTTRAK